MEASVEFETAREQGRTIVLDGGLATELERRGFALDDPLWSARVLIEHPEAVRQLHLDYLAAGAQCITTASYQATIPGLRARGLDVAQARRLLVRSTQLALAARDEFRRSGRGDRALIAASLGPYGAYLADGSEFRGDYGLSREQLIDFHGQRFEILAESGADMLAFETIPCVVEGEAIAKLLERNAGVRAWVSFSCRDDERTCHGEPIGEAVGIFEGITGVVAVGVNCTAPAHIEGLIARIRESTSKPIVAYPNSGQAWDAEKRRWVGESRVERFVSLARRWHEAGATGIGGCCMTGPEHIRELARMAEDDGVRPP